MCNIVDVLISVIMPVFNQEKYLRMSIDSILTQTYENFELIIVDDSSTDESYCIAASYCDKRIKLFRNSTNKGVVYSRNFAIEISKGEYIALMDSDDISFPDRFKIQIEFLLQHPEVGVCGTFARVVDSNGKIKEKLKLYSNNDDLKAVCMFSSPFINPTVMAKADILKKNLYSDKFIISQDTELWIRLLNKTLFCNISKVLLLYRVHSFNAIKRVSILEYNDLLRYIARKRYDIFVNDDKYKEVFMSLLIDMDRVLIKDIDYFFYFAINKYNNEKSFLKVLIRKYVGLMIAKKEYFKLLASPVLYIGIFYFLKCAIKINVLYHENDFNSIF